MGVEGDRDGQGGEVRGGVEVDRDKRGDGGGADTYGDSRASGRGGEGEPGEMGEGGGEREGNKGIGEVRLLEKDDGDREGAGDTAEEVEFSRGGGGWRETIDVPGYNQGGSGGAGVEEGRRRGGERRGVKRESHMRT